MPAGIRRSSGLVSATPYGLARPVAYTPVVTWPGNTITTQSGFYMKLPGLLLVWVSFVETAGTANATMTITIPPGYTVVTMAGALAVAVGGVQSLANTNVAMVSAASGATTSIATNLAQNGIVTSWFGFFQIPTTT